MFVDNQKKNAADAYSSFDSSPSIDSSCRELSSLPRFGVRSPAVLKFMELPPPRL
jgi:hypothetical protein